MKRVDLISGLELIQAHQGHGGHGHSHGHDEDKHVSFIKRWNQKWRERKAEADAAGSEPERAKPEAGQSGDHRHDQ